MRGLPLYNESFEELFREFDRMIITKGYSGGKDNMFPACVREFLFFLEVKEVIKIQDVKGAHVIAYYEYLKSRPNQRRDGGLSERTISHHLGALRMFFDFLMDADIISSSPARLPKFRIGKGNERNIATLEQIKEIYKNCKTKRDKAIVSIAYGCGLRRSEIEQLNTPDVLLHKGILIVRNGKGGKSRTIPLSIMW